MQKLNRPISDLTSHQKRIYKKPLKDLKKNIEIKFQQFNIDLRNLFFEPFRWKIRIPFTIYIRETRSGIEDKIMENPEFAKILKSRMLLQIEEYKVKYVKMINMIKMSLHKKDYEDIMFTTFKKRYFYPYLSWHAPSQKFVKIVTEVYDIFYFENDKLPWIKLDCYFLFDTEKFIIKYMNEWADGFIDPDVANVKDFFIRFNYAFPTIITLFQAERFRQQILDMIAFQLVQTKYNYWKDLFSRLMSRQESVFLALRNQIELSWLDTHVLRFNFPFLSGQTVRIMNSHSKKIKMSRFKNLFKNIKKKNTIKKKTKGDKINRETKSDVGRKRALLTHKYKTGRKTKVKKVGR
jgi:hypothetical protein